MPFLALLLPLALADDVSAADPASAPREDALLLDPQELPDDPPVLAAPAGAPSTERAPRTLTLSAGIASIPDRGVGHGLALSGTQRLTDRARLTVGAGLGVPSHGGTFPDDGETVAWRAHHRVLLASAGLELRALPADEALSPELSLGPALGLTSRRIAGRHADAEFTSVERPRLRAGLHASVALAGDVGPGALVGAVGLDLLPGSDAIALVTPTLGWRVAR